MNSEYVIKIFMNKHIHDNYFSPFYWNILKYDTNWHQIACGWSCNPRESFDEAMACYSKLQR